MRLAISSSALRSLTKCNRGIEMSRMDIYPALTRSESLKSLSTIECLYCRSATWIFLRCLPRPILKILSSQTQTPLVMKKRQLVFQTTNQRSKSLARLNQSSSTFLFILIPSTNRSWNSSLRSILVLVGSFFAMFCSVGFVNAFGVFQEYYSGHLLSDKSASDISWLGSFNLFCMFGGTIVVGYMNDTHGPRVCSPVFHTTNIPR